MSAVALLPAAPGLLAFVEFALEQIDQGIHRQILVRAVGAQGQHCAKARRQRYIANAVNDRPSAKSVSTARQCAR